MQFMLKIASCHEDNNQVKNSLYKSGLNFSDFEGVGGQVGLRFRNQPAHVKK